jgi:Cutinase
MIRSIFSTATESALTDTPSAGAGSLSRLARHLLIAAPVAALALTGSLITAGPASALDGLHINGTWNVRNTPTDSPNGTVSSGQVVTVDCQADGPSVTVAGFGTSAIWDHIPGRGYVSDLAVVETAYARHDPRIPRCGAPAPPPFVTSTVATFRSAPSFNATVIGTISSGTAITITCQNYGTKYGGSFVWDKVGSGYISDVQVNGTPFNAFDSRLPRCGANYLPVDCSKVLFIGARGSGEPFGDENLGDATSPVQVTRNLLAARGVSLDVAGVIYPAQDVDVLWTRGDGSTGISIGGIAAYVSGEQQGVSTLLADLRARTDGNVCGWQNTRAVLVGYSQGALVVGDAIERMTTQERATIAGVVTYGNPRYNESANGGTGSKGPGLLGARGAYPDGVSGRSRDYCRQDIVCKAGSTNVAEHLRYVNPGPEVANGAAFLAARFGR